MVGQRQWRKLVWHFLVAAAAAGASVWLVAHAHAQSEDRALSEPPGYRANVEEALHEFEERNFEESRALFTRAHMLYPNARTHRGLGFAEFELRNYAACIQQLEEALRSPVKPLEGELRSSTEQLLARARNFVARVFVDVQPASARLSIDGIAVESGSARPLVLQVGEHTLEAQARGFRSEKRLVSVKGGEDEQLTLILAKTDVPSVAREERRWYKSPWLWGAVGVVVVGAAGTAVALTQGGSKIQGEPNGGSADAVLTGPSQ